VTLSVLKECPKLGSEECKFILYEWQEQCEIGQVAGGGGDSDKSERATVGLAMTPAAQLNANSGTQTRYSSERTGNEGVSGRCELSEWSKGIGMMLLGRIEPLYGTPLERFLPCF
jgi:hypothetical protein